MHFARLLLLTTLLPAPLAAQTTKPDLQTRLVNQPLYLRGAWHDDKLSFDPSGQLLNSSTPTSFTVSGIRIKSLKLDQKGLRLDGERVGLEFVKDDMIRVGLKESIRIEISPPQNGDYTTALDHIFTADIADFAPTLPSYWQGEAFKQALLLSHHTVEPSVPAKPNPWPLFKGADRVTPPKVLSTPEPSFSRYARAAKLAGDVLVFLQVDPQGNPQKITLHKPLGMGLDEEAIYAVSQYKFKPAEQYGKPIRVELAVQVTFKVF